MLSVLDGEFSGAREALFLVLRTLGLLDSWHLLGLQTVPGDDGRHGHLRYSQAELATLKHCCMRYWNYFLQDVHLACVTI